MFINRCLLFGSMFILSACMPLLTNHAASLPSLDNIQVGDIVITSSGNVEALFLSLALRVTQDDQNNYDHAEMVFSDLNGELSLGGVYGGQVSAGNLLNRLQGFQSFAIYRPIAPQQQRQKASEILRKWIYDPKINNAEFDYAFSYEPGKTDNFFCAGILNEAYRVSGLPLPFSNREWTPNHLSRHLEELLNAKFQGFLDISSIHHSKDYKKIFSWQRPNLKPDRIQRSKNIVLYLLKQYKQNWRLQPNDKVNIGVALINLPEGVKRLAYLRISLGLFRDDIFATWDRLDRRGQLDELDALEKDNLLTAIMDKYREKYFIFMANTIANN